MNRANYIIFHPDNARDPVRVSATSLVGGKIKRNWLGTIWVDAVGNGNEDPYVFRNGWIYSYCHASQLRRQPSENYLQVGSWLIFCSGDKANDGVLCVDTVFEIGQIHQWAQMPHLSLPVSFKSVKKDEPDAWKRHFKFPFDGYHDSVTHSYEARLGRLNSFLPLVNEQRVCIDFDELPKVIRDKVSSKVKGKYPVNLTEKEMSVTLEIIRKRSHTFVLSDIKLLSSPTVTRKSGC
ncbi:hypothetical protein [Pseudochryseolinea flava]|uniref:Uncharacterized protein n=1 Tax=Pseudochryseolinea flava TaxID=2059302 RepID=A0A364Y465_9BACT|nr:hypothetical protein [Pseudochryseolinea flava]RAW01556.1 hypothetical protein DQQ10_07815 [Pseudochryseolinea flava]